MAGKVVAVRPDGKSFDHEREVAEAIIGMARLIRQLKHRLSYPGLSDADREAATALLAEASRKIEEVRRMVPGIEKKLGAYK